MDEYKRGIPTPQQANPRDLRFMTPIVTTRAEGPTLRRRRGETKRQRFPPACTHARRAFYASEAANVAGGYLLWPQASYRAGLPALNVAGNSLYSAPAGSRSSVSSELEAQPTMRYYAPLLPGKRVCSLMQADRPRCVARTNPMRMRSNVRGRQTYSMPTYKQSAHAAVRADSKLPSALEAITLGTKEKQ